MELSYDADLLISPIDEENARILLESLGQESLFAKRQGYYADVLRPEITETLPPGWETRLLSVPDVAHSFSLNPLDLCLVKLILSRSKDLLLVRQLIERGIVTLDILRRHYRSAGLSDADAAKAGRSLLDLSAPAKE